MNAKQESGLRFSENNVLWLGMDELLYLRPPIVINGTLIAEIADRHKEMLDSPHVHPCERAIRLDPFNNFLIHSVHHRFEVHAQLNPGAGAIKSDRGQLTYGELDCQADGLAAKLQQTGVGSGHVCVVCMTPSISMVRAVLAILKAGGAYLLLDPTQEPERMVATLGKSDSAIVILDEDSSNRLMAPNAKTILCGESGVDLPYAWPQEYPTGTLSPAYAIATFPAADGSNFAFITHQSIVGQLAMIQEFSPISQGDSLMLNANCSLSTFAWKCLWPLAYGARLVIQSTPETNPERMLEFIARERITVMHAEPSLLHLLLADSHCDGLRSLRALFCANQRSTGTSGTTT